MKKLILILGLACCAMMAQAQTAVVGNQIKALNVMSANDATILGEHQGNLIIATQYTTRFLSKYVEHGPYLLCLDGKTMEEKGVYKMEDEDLKIRYASLSAGKIYLLMSKNNKKSGGVYKAVVDAKTMTQVGNIEPLYESTHARKDKLYMVVRESPDKNIVALSIVFDDQEAKEFSHKVMVFDNELNTLWSKNYGKLYTTMCPTNYGDVVMVDIENNVSPLIISVLNEEGGTEYECSENIESINNIDILNITDGGKLVMGGNLGNKIHTLGTFGMSFDLEKGELVGSNTYHLTKQDEEILDNRKPGKGYAAVPATVPVARTTTSFGAVFSYSNIIKTVIHSDNGSKVYYDHYGLLTTAVDTMGNVLWCNCQRHAAHENNHNYHVRYGLAERNGQVHLLMSRHPKTTTDPNLTVKLIKLKGSRSTTPKNCLITLDKSGRSQEAEFDMKSNAFVLDPVYDDGKGDMLFFLGRMGKVYLGSIQY